jgi:hypothetical protein
MERGERYEQSFRRRKNGDSKTLHLSPRTRRPRDFLRNFLLAHFSGCCGERKANFRTFIASLAALWMNLDDVVARTADGQTPTELVRAQALRQVATVSLVVQSIVWMQAVLEHVAVAKAEHVVARRRVMVLLGAVDMIALVS